MRLTQAKEYVAGKLGCSLRDLADPVAMREIRGELGLGRIPVQDLTYPNEAGALEAKFHIAAVLDVPIYSVECFRRRAGIDG
jgi:hypothetical protein